MDYTLIYDPASFSTWSLRQLHSNPTLSRLIYDLIDFTERSQYALRTRSKANNEGSPLNYLQIVLFCLSSTHSNCGVSEARFSIIQYQNTETMGKRLEIVASTSDPTRSVKVIHRRFIEHLKTPTLSNFRLNPPSTFPHPWFRPSGISGIQFNVDYTTYRRPASWVRYQVHPGYISGKAAGGQRTAKLEREATGSSNPLLRL
ncbi:hypothetical protein C8R43DRAFT_1130695 [Mycena crocata]|nr:hypothetical protein C8R43DRAFT_1130691 [Mycena crocata]KAJ7143627.1 hypothetical protein C8R43DRAFT_1130695 [Mycena crocata]